MITWQISSRIADASIPHNPVYAGLPRTYLKIAEGSVARGSRGIFSLKIHIGSIRLDISTELK
jgi:hypothetical protein